MSRWVRKAIIDALRETCAPGAEPIEPKTRYRAPCPLCKHLIEVTEIALMPRVENDKHHDVILCAGCLKPLFLEPPGFRPLNRAQFNRLPPELIAFLERTRAVLLELRRMLH